MRRSQEARGPGAKTPMGGGWGRQGPRGARPWGLVLSGMEATAECLAGSQVSDVLISVCVCVGGGPGISESSTC